eukprot:SAG11_NODE_11746_length_740_cov_1.257410_1_plen_55_part_10
MYHVELLVVDSLLPLVAKFYQLEPRSYCGNATTRFDTDEVIRFTSIPSQILDVLG